MRLSITTDFPRIQKELERLNDDVRRKATASALNRVVAQARTQMVREITRDYAVTAAYARQRLTIRRAFAGGRINMEAVLSGSAKKRSANLINFNAKETKKGVTVRISRAGGRKLIRGAFIGNKGRTVFTRVDGTKMASRAQYRGKHAEKIKPVQTIDIPQMFNTRRINAAVVRAIREKFPDIMAREVRFRLRKFAGAR